MSSEPKTGAGGRIAMADEGRMTERQLEVYDKIVSGRRGKIVGPLRAVLHSPELADRWQALGEFLRYHTQLPAVLSELAIIMTGRYWNCQLEWVIHSRIASESGVAAGVIEAIRLAEAPEFDDPLQIAVYDFTRELLAFGQVSDAAYEQLVEAVDVVATVELTAVIGYYSMVAMTLSVHDVPLPADEHSLRLDVPQRVGLLAPTRLPPAIATASVS